MKLSPLQALAFAMAAGLPWQTAQAALTVQTFAGQAAVVYDDATNLSWLIDGALAASSSQGDGSGITYGGAKDWIASLNSSQWLGASTWRLPLCTVADCFIATGGNGTEGNDNRFASEWSTLFYGSLGQTGDTSAPAQLAPFRNLADRDFWLGNNSVNMGGGAEDYWYFSTWGGSQTHVDQDSPIQALAVVEGRLNLPVQVVPEPSSAAMLLAGLGLLARVGRRRATPAKAAAGEQA